MAATEMLSAKTGFSNFGLRDVLISNIQRFCDECDQFIKKQYQEIIRGNPSGEIREQHQRELKWVLRTAKLLECVAADPDSCSSAIERLLRAKIWQLERTWKMLYDPITEKEADQVLAEVFPDESRA
jgi:hypothetical protein